MASKYIKELKDKVMESLPEKTAVSSVEMEGPEVAIYTKSPKAFFEDENYVAKIAFDLKKRVNVRTDKSLLSDEAEAKKKIMKIVPEDADIKDIYFNPAFSEVVIEAIKPGLVIGKGGETSKKIIIETGWTPNIIRAPIYPSKILKGLRQYIHKYSSERKKILKATAERIYREVDEPREKWVRVHALGGFREVGRSCLFIETPLSKIFLDCGMSNIDVGENFPYFDALNFPLSDLDAVVVAHAHLDHSGLVPYLFKAGYRGPVYSTEPTRDLMCLLQFDSINVLVREGKDPPYTEQQVKEMAKYCIPRDYREVTDIAPDVRLTLHNASHILGSSSVHLHIGEGAHNLLYTSDFKYGFTRLFNPVDMKYPRLETLIMESTYGSREDIRPRHVEAENKIIDIIKETVQTGGNVLIPVFAVGRAQEITLLLEDNYRKGNLDEGTKVYIDGMTKEASAIHTAYPEFLRKNVQRRILRNDSPFTSPLFEEAERDQRDEILEKGSSIVMASSGMLNGGPSVDYFHKMAENPDNTLIFVSYQGVGSTGRKVQQGVKTIPINDEKGRTKALEIKMRVETVEGFSGHSYRDELVNYVRNLKPKPKRILLDHGEQSKISDLSKYLSNKFKVSSVSLQNLDVLRLK